MRMCGADRLGIHQTMPFTYHDFRFVNVSVKFVKRERNAVTELKGLLMVVNNVVRLLEYKSRRNFSAGICMKFMWLNFFPATLLILGKP